LLRVSVTKDCGCGKVDGARASGSHESRSSKMKVHPEILLKTKEVKEQVLDIRCQA